MRYKARGICQMHYFRFMRNGSYDIAEPKLRIENPAGYQQLWQPDHPLAGKSGYVFEHRVVLYAAIGPAPMECAICGVGLTWKTCKVDHIDEDVRNNARSNLRPTCNFCNTRRGMRPPVEWSRTHKITFEGITLTPFEWTRDPRVQVAHNTIVLRKARGATDAEALFGEKKTHNGRGRSRPPRAKTKALKQLRETTTP